MILSSLAAHLISFSFVSQQQRRSPLVGQRRRFKHACRQRGIACTVRDRIRRVWRQIHKHTDGDDDGGGGVVVVVGSGGRETGRLRKRRWWQRRLTPTGGGGVAVQDADDEIWRAAEIQRRRIQ